MNKPIVTLELGSGAVLEKSHYPHWAAGASHENGVLVLSDPAWVTNRWGKQVVPEPLRGAMRDGKPKWMADGKLSHCPPRWVAELHRRHGNVFGFAALAESIPMHDDSVRHVVARNMFGSMYFRFNANKWKVDATVDEIHRVLAPGGTLEIIENYTPEIAPWKQLRQKLKASGMKVVTRTGSYHGEYAKAREITMVATKM